MDGERATTGVTGQRFDTAVIGAGPAGSRAAWRLARGGQRVLLLDHRAPWEKPCGGGLNPRAARLLAESLALPGAAPAAGRLLLQSPRGTSLLLELDRPLRFISRATLQRRMIEEARAAGVRCSNERVVALERGEARGSWEILGAGGGRRFAGLVVAADGAAGRLSRRLAGGKEGQPPRPAMGLVRLLPRVEPRGEILLQFHEEPPGYLWEFPGEGSLNQGFSLPFGARGDGRARELLRERLRRAFAEGDGSAGGPLPPLRAAPAPGVDDIPRTPERIQGADWALLGDAAGLADPLTGEGIYYALLSADLLAAAVLGGRASDYGESVLDGPARELQLAARWAPRFFAGGFTGRMLGLAARHRGIRRVLGDLLAGEQEYAGLRRRLLRAGPLAAVEHFLGRRLERG